jgi:hypothetical protein
MAIKYTPELNKEIRRIVGNYNKRVKRLYRKSPTQRNLPPLVKASEIKKLYETKSDLKQRLKLLNSFNKSSLNTTQQVTPAGDRINAYRYQTAMLNYKIALNRINEKLNVNKRLDREAGRIIPSARTRALMAEKRTITRAITDNGDITNINKFRGALRVTERYTDRRAESDKQFYDNFFDMLWSDQNFAELDPDLVQSIQERLQELSPEQLLEAYNNEPILSSIVEDYNKYVDTAGKSITDDEVYRSRVRLEMLDESLDSIISKYSKM